MTRPKDASYWNTLGIALFKQGEFAEAEKAFHTAIVLDPRVIAFCYNLGNTLYEQGKLAEAEIAYLAAIELDPKVTNCWYNLGVALSNQSKFEKAEKAFLAAIELEPEYVTPWCGLGAALFDQYRFAEAEKAYLAAIELDSELVELWNGLGNALDEQGRFEDADKAYLTAIELDPEYALPWYGLAVMTRRRDGGMTRWRDSGPLVTTFMRRFVYLGGIFANSSSIRGVYVELIEGSFHPLFILNATELNSRLLLSMQWSVARDRALAALVKPMQCLDVLEELEDSFETFFLKALIRFRYGDITDDTFDVINDKYEEEILGQYYLLVYLNSLAKETGPSEEEALEYARGVEENCSDPEQLFVAGLIFLFCEQNDRAENCWQKNGNHLASMYLLMLLKHEQGREEERNVLVSKILDEENRRIKNGDIGYLGGLPQIDDYDCAKKEDREQLIRCLRYDEVSDAVETLHNLVDENPQNPAWNQFMEAPVSRLKYGPCSIIDIWSVKPEQQEKYRDVFIRREERAAELLNELKDIDTVFYPPEHRLVGGTMTETEDNVAIYLRTGKDAPPVKQKIIGYLYQCEKLDAIATICLLLYFEQYRNQTLNNKRLSEFITSAAGSLGGVVLSTLLSDSLPAQLAGAGAGAGAGAVLGPALSNIIENVAFSVRYEDYREFRQLIAGELGIQAAGEAS